MHLIYQNSSMCAVCIGYSHKLTIANKPTGCLLRTKFLNLGLVSSCFAAVLPLLAVVSDLWLLLY